MILRYEQLSQHPSIFKSMTGLNLSEFEGVAEAVLPLVWAYDEARGERGARQRAAGAGAPFRLGERDQVLLTVVWLRQYPTYEVLGYLFGISDTTAGRMIRRILPLLEQDGRTTMRMPDPGRPRRQLDELLAETPELVVLVDTFEQRVQRPRQRPEADGYYSGKKKQHTLKVQVAVDEQTAEIVAIAPSVPGPTADITLLKESPLLADLPPEVGLGGDLAYIGLANLLPPPRVVTPRRKPRAKPRPPEDQAFNRAFARRRVVIEHTIGRLRRYQSLTQTDRHHRQLHSARTLAVAGLVNRQLRHRFSLPA